MIRGKRLYVPGELLQALESFRLSNPGLSNADLFRLIAQDSLIGSETRRIIGKDYDYPIYKKKWKHQQKS